MKDTNKIDIDKKYVKDHLQGIVDSFNERFTQWCEASGCSANFAWQYKDGKLLTISSIDISVYKNEPPSAAELARAIDRKSILNP
jgi:hypothetical protein